MTSLKSNLEQWVDTADAKQRQRPVRWQIARVIVGAVMLVKSIGIFRHAEGLEGFALAALLFAGALALIFDAVRLMRAGEAEPNT